MWRKLFCDCFLKNFFFLLSCQVVSDTSDPMDCSPPGSSVHRILQERVLEWVAIFFLQGIFLEKKTRNPWRNFQDKKKMQEPMSPALQAVPWYCRAFFTAEPPGKPLVCLVGKNIHPVLCTSCRIYMIGWLGICLTVHILRRWMVIIGKYLYTVPIGCTSRCLNLFQKDLMKLDSLQSFQRTKEMIKLTVAQREARRKE